MIVHMSCNNTNLYIPIPLTICLCLAIGNDLLNIFTRLSTNLICFTSKYDPNNSQVKETLVRCAWFDLLRCSLPLYEQCMLHYLRKLYLEMLDHLENHKKLLMKPSTNRNQIHSHEALCMAIIFEWFEDVAVKLHFEDPRDNPHPSIVWCCYPLQLYETILDPPCLWGIIGHVWHHSNAICWFSVKYNQ